MEDSVVLTQWLFDEMEKHLLDDIDRRDSLTRVGSLGYLGQLQHVPVGTVLAPDHPLMDVIEFWGILDE